MKLSSKVSKMKKSIMKEPKTCMQYDCKKNATKFLNAKKNSFTKQKNMTSATKNFVIKHVSLKSIIHVKQENLLL